MIRFTRTDNTETPYHIPNNIEIPLDDVLLCILCKYEVQDGNISQNIIVPEVSTTAETQQIQFEVVNHTTDFSKIIVKINGRQCAYKSSPDVQCYLESLSKKDNNVNINDLFICFKQGNTYPITFSNQLHEYINYFKANILMCDDWLYDIYKVNMQSTDEVRVIFDYYDIQPRGDNKYIVYIRINTYSATVSRRTYNDVTPDYKHQFVACLYWWDKPGQPQLTHIARIKYHTGRSRYCKLYPETRQYNNTNKPPNPDELIKLGFKSVG